MDDQSDLVLEAGHWYPNWLTYKLGRNDRQEVKTEYRKKRRSSSGSRKRRRRRHLQRLFLSFSCSFSAEEMLVCSQLQHPCRHCLLVTSSFLFINAGWSPFHSEKKTYWSCSKPHFKASQGGCETVLTWDLIKTSDFGREWRYSRWEEGPDFKGVESVCEDEWVPASGRKINTAGLHPKDRGSSESLSGWLPRQFWLFSSSTTKR